MPPVSFLSPLNATLPTHQRRRFLVRTLLLFLLAALLIGGGSLGYSVFQNAALQAQATATAQANASATSNTEATIVANELAAAQANLATATAQAQATAGVLQTATAGQPDYFDPLTTGHINDTTWTNDGAFCSFSTSGYMVRADPNSPSANHPSCVESDRSYQDATITVEMHTRSGYSSGLLFRLQNGQGYFFEIGTSGNYHIGNWGRAGSPQDWTNSSAIQQGYDSLNTLQVITRKNDLFFYINGVYLTHIQDTTFNSGNIGFVCEGDPTPCLAVFSNLEIYP